MTPPILNTSLIAARRSEMRLSEREIERALGVGGGWAKSLLTGANHPYIALNQLEKLTELLGVDMQDLFTKQPAEVHDVPNDPDAVARDVVRLGRILTDLPNQTPLSVLAGELDWTLQRTTTVALALERRLHLVGQRLVQGVAGIQIVRDSPEPDAAALAVRAKRIKTNGMTQPQASVLARVLVGEITKKAASSVNFSFTDSTALRDLVRAGLVQEPGPDRNATYTATDAVLSSLLRT